MRAEHHDEFVAIDEADTVFAALDGAIEKMENQLRRFKERLKEHRAVGAQAPGAAAAARSVLVDSAIHASRRRAGSQGIET